MSKTIFPYVRFSSPEQMKGDSQRRQIEKIRHYAVSNGYQLNETLDLQDLGLSAYHAEHMEADAGLGRFLLAIESGLIPLDGTSYLCIEQLDRLSRQSIDQANELFKKILRANVNIITMMDSRVYTKDSLNNFMEIVYSLFLMEQAHQESAKKASRIKSVFNGRLAKLERGEKIQYAGQIPGWLKKTKVSGVFEIDEAKANVVREIFTRKSNDESLKKIADDLNSRGVSRLRNKSDGSKLWTTGALSNLLKAESTYGVLIVKQTTKIKSLSGNRSEVTELGRFDSYYPAVISRELFMSAREKLKEINTIKDYGRSTSKNLFSGLVYCGYCGERMYFDEDDKMLKSGRKYYRHLKCIGYLHKLCDKGKLKYDNFENVFPWSYAYDAEKGSAHTQAKISALGRDRLSIEGELSMNKERLESLTAAFEASEDYDADFFLKTTSSISRKIAAKQRELDSIITQISFFAGSVAEPLEFDLTNASDRDKAKAQLKRILAAIIVYPAESMGFLLFKNGNVQSIDAIARAKTDMKAFSYFARYAKDLKQKLESGSGDAKLKKIFDALRHWSD